METMTPKDGPTPKAPQNAPKPLQLPGTQIMVHATAVDAGITQYGPHVIGVLGIDCAGGSRLRVHVEPRGIDPLISVLQDLKAACEREQAGIAVVEAPKGVVLPDGVRPALPTPTSEEDTAA
jgi:hypothetical protein